LSKRRRRQHGPTTHQPATSARPQHGVRPRSGSDRATSTVVLTDCA